MQKQANLKRVSLLVLWTVILSALTAVLGAVPLKTLRQIVGQGPYWLICVCLIAVSAGLGLLPLALILGINTLLVGCFKEFEEREFDLRQSAGFAILITALLFTSGFYVWTSIVGKGWLTQILTFVEALLTQAQAIKVDFLREVKAQDIVAQAPSAVFIYMIMALGLALIFEKRVSKWMKISYSHREKLADFHTPDAVIWIFIASLLGGFAQLGLKPIEIISINTLNVCLVIYFFQGLAVLATYFGAFRISAVWKVLWVFILVVQLPILMSLLGLVDYWADFRKALAKRAAQLKNEKKERLQ